MILGIKIDRIRDGRKNEKSKGFVASM